MTMNDSLLASQTKNSFLVVSRESGKVVAEISKAGSASVERGDHWMTNWRRDELWLRSSKLQRYRISTGKSLPAPALSKKDEKLFNEASHMEMDGASQHMIVVSASKDNISILMKSSWIWLQSAKFLLRWVTLSFPSSLTQLLESARDLVPS